VSEQLSAEDLRRLMDVVRHRMTGEAAKVAGDARKLTDWKFYLHEFTGPMLAGASLLGFLLVPKKSKPIADMATLEELAQKKGWVVDSVKATTPAKAGLFGSVASLAGGMLLKAGVNYAGQRLSQVLGPPIPQPLQQEPQP
jgi:hypothetical protein